MAGIALGTKNARQLAARSRDGLSRIVVSMAAGATTTTRAVALLLLLLQCAGRAAAFSGGSSAPPSPPTPCSTTRDCQYTGCMDEGGVAYPAACTQISPAQVGGY